MKLFVAVSAMMMLINNVSGESLQVTLPPSSEIAYLTYSSDNECKDLALAKPVLNNVTFSIPILSDATQPCSELVVCAVDASSPQCEAVGGSATMDMAQLSVEVRNNGQEVWECDTSNEAAGEDRCAYKAPKDCFASSILPGCYVRYVTAQRFQELVMEAVESCDKTVGDSSDGSRLLTNSVSFAARFVSVALRVFGF